MSTEVFTNEVDALPCRLSMSHMPHIAGHVAKVMTVEQYEAWNAQNTCAYSLKLHEALVNFLVDVADKEHWKPIKGDNSIRFDDLARLAQLEFINPASFKTTLDRAKQMPTNSDRFRKSYKERYEVAYMKVMAWYGEASIIAKDNVYEEN